MHHWGLYSFHGYMNTLWVNEPFFVFMSLLSILFCQTIHCFALVSQKLPFLQYWQRARLSLFTFVDDILADAQNLQTILLVNIWYKKWWVLSSYYPSPHPSTFSCQQFCTHYQHHTPIPTIPSIPTPSPFMRYVIQFMNDPLKIF